MKCYKCDTDADGKTSKVYYSRIITQSTKSFQAGPGKTREVTTKTYKNILNEDIHICNECLIKHKRNELIRTPLYILLPIFFFWWPFLFSLFDAPEDNLALSIVCNVIPGGIMLIVIAVSIIKLIKKSYMDVSKFDAYPLSKQLLKKHLRKRNPKTRYSFWRSYPKNLKRVRY